MVHSMKKNMQINCMNGSKLKMEKNTQKNVKHIMLLTYEATRVTSYIDCYKKRLTRSRSFEKFYRLL